MPVAAVASSTPGMAGRTGKPSGARGDLESIAEGILTVSLPARRASSGLKPGLLFFGLLFRLHGFWLSGAAAEVLDLDLGILAQLRADFLNGCGRDHFLQLAAHLIARGLLGLAAILYQDHVPAKLRFHRLGAMAARLHIEGGIGEGRHHAVAGEVAKVAATPLGAGVRGVLLRQR